MPPASQNAHDPACPPSRVGRVEIPALTTSSAVSAHQASIAGGAGSAGSRVLASVVQVVSVGDPTPLYIRFIVQVQTTYIHMKHEKKTVSRQALLARVNRKLRDEAMSVRKCREASRWWPDLGDYYLVDVNCNAVLEKHLDLEGYARELSALKPIEKLAV